MRELRRIGIGQKSPLGKTLEPILMAVKGWGDANIGLFGPKVAAKPPLVGTQVELVE
jgi:hypothetical protein